MINCDIVFKFVLPIWTLHKIFHRFSFCTLEIQRKDWVIVAIQMNTQSAYIPANIISSPHFGTEFIFELQKLLCLDFLQYVLFYSHGIRRKYNVKSRFAVLVANHSSFLEYCYIIPFKSILVNLDISRKNEKYNFT